MEVSRNKYIDILVENIAKGPINANFQTTKPDKANHGFGLAHIKAVASRYNGVATPSFDPVDGKFILRVMLKNEKP